ncbi:CoxG family protein, partial [Hansschlegelia beijingensis]
MDISGSHRIPAPRATVWAALNDPAILRDCLPGCERLERSSEDVFEGAASAKIGPIKGDFAGSVTRSDVTAPERFTLQGEGDGGAAGSAKGRAEVTLKEEAGETVVSYTAQADLTGKISQLGARLVTGFARKTAETFFERLAERLAQAPVAAA